MRWRSITGWMRLRTLILAMAAALCSGVGCRSVGSWSFWNTTGDRKETTEQDVPKNDASRMSNFMGQVRGSQQEDKDTPKQSPGDWLYFSDPRSREINRNLGK